MSRPITSPPYFRMKLGEFMRTFVGKPPARNTLKAMIDRRDYLGERVGATYFLFVDEHGQPLKPTQEVATGNSEADVLLQNWLQTR